MKKRFAYAQRFFELIGSSAAGLLRSSHGDDRDRRPIQPQPKLVIP
jgi:hypothetical protein